MIEFIIDTRETLLKLWFENKLKKQSPENSECLKPVYQNLLIDCCRIIYYL